MDAATKLCNGLGILNETFPEPVVNKEKEKVDVKKKRKKRRKSIKTEAQMEADAAKRKGPSIKEEEAVSGPSSEPAPAMGATAEEPRPTQESPLEEVTLDLVQKLWLDVNHLTTLKKRSPKHPNALFYCKLCNYYCMSLEHCENHIKEQKHCRNYLEEEEFSTLLNLPVPTKFHSDAVSQMLEKVHEKFGISEAEKQIRVVIANEISALLCERLPGVKVYLYGSSLTGFGLVNSDLNLDFVVDQTLNAPEMLKAAFNLLSTSDMVKCVMSDFHTEIPSVLFMHRSNRIKCVLSLNSHEAYKTSQLLAKYCQMDHRVKILGTAFRMWSNMCKIDDHLMGLLPAYSYHLMLVYFLQQIQPPVLPVVKDIDTEVTWKTSNKMSAGELWIQLFRYYTIDHPKSENVVCIRSLENVKRSEKNWTGKKIAIEDPFLRKRNVSRYIVNHTSHDFIYDCLKNTYRYFGIPQTDAGPIFALIRKPMEEYRQIPDVARNMKMAELNLNTQMDNDYRFFKVETPSTCNMIPVSELEEKFREASLMNSKKGKAKGKSVKNESAPANFEVPVQQKQSYVGQYTHLVVSPKLANALCSRLRNEYHFFKMDEKFFTLGRAPPIVCNICQQEGHTKSRCPDNYLPPLQALPPMNDMFLRQLDMVCCQVIQKWSPNIEEIEERQAIVNDLEQYLRNYYKTVKLELFGSSCNGFGFHKSDLDICLTFTDNQTGENINYVALIEELVHHLKAYGKLTNLIPITTAKVPIVKFTYPKSKLDCDISLYNTLAQRNTHMLKMYTQIDERVKILGFAIKRFAKLCDICDASRGSLSSYAYILMVIYFLQQCDPPVIPVLQQLYEEDKQPEIKIEGWNTWYFEDLDNLKNIWPHLGENKCSVGDLWLQMLRFYTETFDFNEHVVCIRKKEKLLRFEKLWNSKCMAIEDPFDLGHNLGSGLSRKMNNFIIKAFRKGRLQFGTPITQLPPTYKDLQDYLFDPSSLTDGQPPNDRGCRICKKIGHICKDCPQRKNSRRRQGDKGNEKASNSQQLENKQLVRPHRIAPPAAFNRTNESQEWALHQQRMEQARRLGPASLVQQQQQQQQMNQHKLLLQYRSNDPSPRLPMPAAGLPPNNWWPGQPRDAPMHLRGNPCMVAPPPRNIHPAVIPPSDPNRPFAGAPLLRMDAGNNMHPPMTAHVHSNRGLELAKPTDQLGKDLQEGVAKTTNNSENKQEMPAQYPGGVLYYCSEYGARASPTVQSYDKPNTVSNMQNVDPQKIGQPLVNFVANVHQQQNVIPTSPMQIQQPISNFPPHNVSKFDSEHDCMPRNQSVYPSQSNQSASSPVVSLPGFLPPMSQPQQQYFKPAGPVPNSVPTNPNPNPFLAFPYLPPKEDETNPQISHPAEKIGGLHTQSPPNMTALPLISSNYRQWAHDSLGMSSRSQPVMQICNQAQQSEASLADHAVSNTEWLP